MSLYAIADLHLSFESNKPMDIFDGFSGYVEKIKENWEGLVKEDDVVVVAGDVSWGMKFEECRLDFEFIEKLPGRKILMKGNHDYYFSTKNKMDKFFSENGFFSLNFLFNNSYEYGDYSICGTRGWVNLPGEAFDEKILKREAGRLELSLKSAKKKPIVFLHYPPIICGNRSEEILKVLEKYDVDRVFYGHLHGTSCQYGLNGEFGGIKYRLISSDFLKFKPLKIF